MLINSVFKNKIQEQTNKIILFATTGAWQKSKKTDWHIYVFTSLRF